MPLALPQPDRAVVRQRDNIVADLRRLVPPDTIIADEEGRRAYETDALDGLSPRAAGGSAALLHRGGVAAAALLPRQRHQGGGAGCRHVALGRRAAGRGRSGDRRIAHEPRARHRHHEPHRPGRGRHHQPRHQRGREGGGLLLCARPLQPARLHARRQHRHELWRRPLPQVRRHHQQRARPQDGADGRRSGRDRRRAPRFARLRPDGAHRRLRRAIRDRHGGDGAHPALARRRPPHAAGFRLQRRLQASACPPSSPPASFRWPSSSWTSRRSRCARPSPRPATRPRWRHC